MGVVHLGITIRIILLVRDGAGVIEDLAPVADLEIIVKYGSWRNRRAGGFLPIPNAEPIAHGRGNEPAGDGDRALQKPMNRA